MEVVVEYEYDALHEDELSLRLGQLIRNVRRVEEEGWMEGEVNGRRGLFPDNFVKEVRKESREAKEEVKEEGKEDATPQRREKSAGNVAHLVQRMSTYGIPAGGFQPSSQPRTASRKRARKRQCRVLFEYFPQNEDELELKIGDIIDINEEVEEGWWSGTMNGKSGLFPSNFVKEVETGEDGETNDVADETDGSGKEAVLPPSSPQASPGNGIIAQPKKIRGVGFGDIFREGSVKLKVRLPSTDADDKKDKPIPSLPSTAKPAHPSTPDCTRADGDKTKVKEYCKATFAFESTNEDELTLREGDVIQILSKDTGEPGWWRGQIGGQEGVFPDNFVVVMSETEKEAPSSRGSVKLSPKLETEERPKKPPPPSKNLAPKPEVPSADKKPQQPRPEDRGDHKHGKPGAPVVPPKKPVPPPGKSRPGSLPPKRPDKPLAPSPGTRHNGEVPSLRPKSDFEPTLPSKPKTLSGDWGEKSLDLDLMSFDDLSSSSEKLSHPTANRPKMPGRRLPAQRHSPSTEVSVEKPFRMEEKEEEEEEEEEAKPKLTDTRKPSIPTLSHPSPVLKPSPASSEPRPSAASPPSPSPASARGPSPSPASARGPSTEPDSRAEAEEQGGQLEELRAQMRELLLSVELMKTQQKREIADLREELDEEKLKRVALQVEIEKLKRTVQST